MKPVGFVIISWVNWLPSKYLWATNNITLWLTSRMKSPCLFTKVLIRCFALSNHLHCWPTAWFYQGGYDHYFLRILEQTATSFKIQFHWICFFLIPLVFRLNYSASDTNDRNRVKSRLKKFISRRPSLKTLQEKGLIKGLLVLCIFS